MGGSGTTIYCMVHIVTYSVLVGTIAMIMFVVGGIYGIHKIHNILSYDIFILTYHGIGHHKSIFDGTYGGYTKHVTRLSQ